MYSLGRIEYKTVEYQKIGKKNLSVIAMDGTLKIASNYACKGHLSLLLILPKSISILLDIFHIQEIKKNEKQHVENVHF